MLWGQTESTVQMHELFLVTFLILLILLLFSLPALGLALTSKQTIKALKIGDRWPASRSKGRPETCCFRHGQAVGFGASPPPSLGFSPPIYSGWAISAGLPGSGSSEMGMKELLLFFLTNFQAICQMFSTRPLLGRH